MGIITLEEMEFFAYHGASDEEQKTGNRYAVDITVQTDFERAAREDKLEYTLDYGQLYQLVYQQMQQPARLLEHLAYRISEAVLQQFVAVEVIEVSVRKFNPPLGGICRSSRISLRRQRGQQPGAH